MVALPFCSVRCLLMSPLLIKCVYLLSAVMVVVYVHFAVMSSMQGTILWNPHCWHWVICVGGCPAGVLS